MCVCGISESGAGGGCATRRREALRGQGERAAVTAASAAAAAAVAAQRAEGGLSKAHRRPAVSKAARASPTRDPVHSRGLGSGGWVGGGD